jgi:hypothetical protein
MDRQADSPTRDSRRKSRLSTVGPLTALLLVLPMAVSFSGCQIIIGTLLTLQGRPMATCEFTSMTKKKLAEKGKKVVVLSSSTAAAQAEEPSLDLDIIDSVSRRLQLDNVNVIDPYKVGAWIDENGGINETTPLAPIGVKFNADYIVLFKFNKFGYGAANTPGMFQGHASYKVVVVEMVKDKDTTDGKRAKVIYNRAFESTFPKNRPVAADEAGTPELFKSKYMARISEDLTRLFVDYRPEDEIN